MNAIKNFVLIALMFVAASAIAQNNTFGDDVYFSSKGSNKAEPKKKEVAVNTVKTNTTNSNSIVVTGTVSGDRDVDEYNRRYMVDDSSYVDDPIYNDSVAANSQYTDGEMTQRIVKFHDPSKVTIVGADNVNVSYDNQTNTYVLDFDQANSSGISININSGYGWNSPWNYPYYGGWYNSWYSWYDPWFYSGWYSPWYYGGWYSPWYYSGWYGGWGGFYPGYCWGGGYGGGRPWYNGGNFAVRNNYSNGRQSNSLGGRGISRSSADNFTSRGSSVTSTRSSIVNGRTSSAGVSRDGANNQYARENITTTRQSSSANGTVSSSVRTRQPVSSSSSSPSTNYNNTRSSNNSSGSYSTPTRSSSSSSNSSSGSYSSGSSRGSYSSGGGGGGSYSSGGGGGSSRGGSGGGRR